MIRALILLALLTGAASGQTYIATEVGKPCPPNDVPVKLQDGRWVCAVTSTLTPLENPMPKDSK
jgi:hypothetical protein